jgi:cation:H+ antiporter
MNGLIFIGGLALLIAGAEVLVKGAVRFAAGAGISPLVTGLTVVAFGTSSPELAVSIKSALDGEAGIAMGNIIGSNIFNILFILGIAALITPLTVSQKLIRFDVPLMIGASILVLILAMDGRISRIEGITLFTGLILYTGFLILESRGESSAVREEYAGKYGMAPASSFAALCVNLTLITCGLGMLVMGSKVLVDSAVAIAHLLDISELIIGLTIIAVGTSLPEVLTSIVASMHGERDIAVGNIVGSNLFNILCVLGISAAVAPAGIAVADAVIRFDLLVMIAVACACFPIFFTHGEISRWEGGVFLGYYVVYTIYLIFSATGHIAMPLLTTAMLYFVLPLTVITLIAVSLRFVKQSNGAGESDNV